MKEINVIAKLQNSCDFGFANGLLEMKAKSQAKKKQVNCISLKFTTCASKDTIKMVGKKLELGKIFANHISNKGLISRIQVFLQLMQLSNRLMTQFLNGPRI